MSAQLDSVTDRKIKETMDEEEALKTLSAGVKLSGKLRKVGESQRKVQEGWGKCQRS